MPLDASDIEKITNIVERATARIDIDVRALMPRSEYETRHTDLHNRTLKNESSINEVVKWVMAEHEKIAARSDTRFKELKDDIKEVGMQVDEVKQSISSERGTTIRYIVSVIVGIILGVVIPLLLKFIGV